MSAALPRDATVAVIGAGAMGAGIAQVAAQAGHPVRLFDTRLGAAGEARGKIAEAFETLVARGKLDQATARDAAGRIVDVHALGDCVSARLVVEAIVEDLDVKRSLFADLEAIVGDEALLATNTSSLSVTAIAAGLAHPQRVVGMHFFNPAPILPLVEVVSGLATSREVAECIYATAEAWGKSPVHAMSTPGFIVNRCARPFYGEGLRLLAERAADHATIDAVMREAGGFRMGPFELMDLIGLDVNAAVTRSVWEAYHNDPRYAPSTLQTELVAAGYLGRKSGRGFYDYAADAPRRVAVSEPAQDRPAHVTVCGDLGVAAPLVERLGGCGIAVERSGARDGFPHGALLVGEATLAPTDGRTATGRAGTAHTPNLVLFDLAFDYARCTRLALARADGCSASAWASAVGVLQAAGIAIARFDDVAGLAVMRTVAMLANEAADAVAQGVASAEDVDIAMRKGVNYPEGPLAWADRIGARGVRDTLSHLSEHYGDGRYRVSPLIARRCASGRPLAGSI